MPKRKSLAGAMPAAALILAGITASAAVPLTPAVAQAYSPMPPACQAASNAVEAEGRRYRQPPPSANLIAQMQHILWAVGLMIDSLDRSCRDWADYARTRAQFQNTYNATMQQCLNMASNRADCRRQPYTG